MRQQAGLELTSLAVPALTLRKPITYTQGFLSRIAIRSPTWVFITRLFEGVRKVIL
jgi:hypothetical protein